MSENQFRAIIFLPLQNFGDDFDLDYMDDLYIDENEYTSAFLKVRNDLKTNYRWKPGSLTPLTEDGIPSTPFSKAIANDLSNSLSSMIGSYHSNPYTDELADTYWYSRRFINFLGSEVKTGIPGIWVDGFELFKYPESDYSDLKFSETHILAVHITATDNPTNRDAVLSLSKLSNDPVKKFLNHFFRTPFNTTMDQPQGDSFLPNKYDILKAENNPFDPGWNFHNLAKTALVAFYSPGNSSEILFKHANMELFHKDDPHGIAQMKSKLAFIGALISFQRLRVDSMRKQWPNLTTLQEEEVISLRAKLAGLRNAWFWHRISYDDQVQKSYSHWVEELDLQVDLDHMNRDIDEYWIVRTAQRAQEEAIEIAKLNRWARLFAIFGIVPAWLSLLVAVFPNWATVLISASSLGLIVVFRNKIDKILRL